MQTTHAQIEDTQLEVSKLVDTMITYREASEIRFANEVEELAFVIHKLSQTYVEPE